MTEPHDRYVRRCGMMNNPVGSYKGMSHWLVVLIKLSTQPLSSETNYSSICLLMDHPPTPIPSTLALLEENELMVSKPVVA